MKEKKQLSPPRAARRLLLFFLRSDLAEEVEGDLFETYKLKLKQTSPFRAKLHYWYEVMHYMRPFAIRKSILSLIHYAMFQNYFKIGWRNLVKQKMYSFVKIGGFALGIAACLLIALFIRDELSYDLQYPDANRIYRVVEVYNDNGEINRGVWMQAPFANSIKEDYPEIEKAGRYNSSELFGAGSNQIRRDDQTENTFEEGFVFADQELLEIMKVPMVYGNLAHCLDQPKTMVITRSRAEKYFPNENPVGKLMVVNNDREGPFKIGGVIEDFPKNSHLHFQFFVTMKGREFWEGEQNYWGANNYPTYLLLRPGTDPKELAHKMDKVVSKYLLPLWLNQGRSEAKKMAEAIHYELQPVTDIHLRNAGIQDPISHGDIRFVWLFGGVAAFILIIACINFVNLSTAKSANRAKEVGLRKTVGSYRSNIVNQFLIESVLFSVLSFAFGILLAWALLPYFNVLAAKSLVFPWGEWWLVPLLLSSCLAIGILAGLYPSFYLSSFRPIQVLKGNVSRGSKNATTRSVLVVFQFTTSIVLIISTFIIYRQVNYILTRDVGFDKEQVLLLQGTNTLGKKVSTLKSELLELSSVQSVTVSDYLPISGTKRNGNGFYVEGRQNVDKSVGGQFWVVDHDYVKTMGMKIVAGRDFSREMASDSSAVVINQRMAKELGLTDPVGKRIQNWEVFTIVGVVEDFNFDTMRGKIDPLLLKLGNSPSIVSVKIKPGNLAASIASIKDIWKKISPHQPIRYAFLDDSFGRMYEDVQRMGHIFTTFAVLAIIVACLGLFALSSFMIEQRGKEISIRLVLGASLKNIFRLLTLNFVKLVFISIVIAAPLAWYMMKHWLEDFTYRIEITWDVFVLGGVMAVMIALVTISYQSIRAGMAKPVNGLRSE
ncbi:ABC transporter permease [Chryseolinea lacunae]|uniref:ABC transporter permease n=1 Tax=Chryseolinea lacunae TaxID=2801331 RepID=A0ABS1KM45_9BACT|nr:ABC transporter permease [Chryseolinea lacunae]MBL0740405.1 ABC transporter permease [Chryseolinea lacunae]